MKKNKGFTLVELVVTIALLGMIGTVVAVNMVGLNKNQEEKEYARMSSIIESAAEVYAEKEASSKTEISVQTLIDAGYLKEKDFNNYKDYSVLQQSDGTYKLQK